MLKKDLMGIPMEIIEAV